MGDDAPQQSLNVHSTPRAAEMRELAARVAALEQERDRRSRIAEILATAGDPRFPVVPESPRRRRNRTPPEKRWLHLVRGAVPASLAAGLVRAHVRHAVAAAAVAAVLAAGGTLTPGVIRDPPALMPRPHAVVHHRDRDAVVHHRRDQGVVVLPLAVPARRKRRTLDDDDVVKAAVSAPLPPGPACVPPHPGRHCHGGDGEGPSRDLPGNHS